MLSELTTAWQSFKKLSKGLGAMANTAESFKSKSIPGLLRSAPDLLPHLKHVKSMFKLSEDSKQFGHCVQSFMV